VAKALQASEALLAERRREAEAYFDAKYDAPLCIAGGRTAALTDGGRSAGAHGRRLGPAEPTSPTLTVAVASDPGASMAIDQSQFAGMTEAERVKAKAKLLLSMRCGRRQCGGRRALARRSRCMRDRRAGASAL